MSEGNTTPEVPSVLPPPADAEPVRANRRTTALTEREGLGFVLDVPVELCVEIGRRVMKLGEIIKLGPGSVLELDKVSGEPLDLYANRKLVARGEAVVVGERYGVRLSEVLVVEADEATR